MNKFYLLLLAVVLFSCGKNPKGFDSKVFTEKEVSDFIRLNPQWNKTDEATTEKFKHKMINLSNEPNFLNDMPFKLKLIRDTTISTLPIKIAEFETFKDPSRAEESLQNDLVLQISGIVSEEQLKKLTINQSYLITGTLYKQGKRASVDLIEENNTKTYLLGKYTFVITNFKKI